MLATAGWHVPLGWWAVRGDHRAGFAAGPVVGVRVGHVGIVVVAGILLMLHRRLAVRHLVMLLLVHRMLLVLLVMVVHVGAAIFAVGSRGILGWTPWMSGRFVRMHSGWRLARCTFLRVLRRMGGRWSTGCRRRSTGSIATGRWRFRSLFPTHYCGTTLRILSTGMSISTILQITTRLVCLWLMMMVVVFGTYS